MPSHPTTVLQIIPELDAGGAERTVLEISAAVRAAGGRSIVVSQGGRLVGELEEAGATHIGFPAKTKSPWGIWRNARALANMIRCQNVDLVHAHSRAPAWSAYLAVRRTGTPFATTFHGAYNENSAIKKAYNRIMARSDVVIANSLYTANLVRSRYAPPEDRLRTVYCGIDDCVFDPAAIGEERVVALRQRWGLRADERAVVLAGRLTALKGQQILIAAVAACRAAGDWPDNARAILAGTDQGRVGYSEALARQIAEAGLDGIVRLVGHEADMPAAFRVADVSVVASSEPETFGRSTAESLAMACPVIATRLGATPEIVCSEPDCPAEAINGWLVAPGRTHDLTGSSEAIAELAAALGTALALSPQERAQIGARGRWHVRSRFNVGLVQRQTLAVYDSCLGTDLESRFSAGTNA